MEWIHMTMETQEVALPASHKLNTYEGQCCRSAWILNTMGVEPKVQVKPLSYTGDPRTQELIAGASFQNLKDQKLEFHWLNGLDST